MHVYTYLCMHATIVTYLYIQLHNSSLQFEGRWQWISLYHTLVCKGTTSVSKILTYIGVDQRTLQCCKRSTIRKLLNLDWTANGKNKWRCNVQGCEVIAAYVNKMTRLEYVSVWGWTLHSTVCRWCVYMVCVHGVCRWCVYVGVYVVPCPEVLLQLPYKELCTYICCWGCSSDGVWEAVQMLAMYGLHSLLQCTVVSYYACVWLCVHAWVSVRVVWARLKA